MATTSFSSTPLFQDFLGKFHSRKLLLLNLHNQQPVSAPPPCPVKSNLDLNVVMFLLVLVCAVICSLGFHFLIRCAFIGCSRMLNSESDSLNLSVNSSGIKKKALKDFPVVNYSTELKLPGLDTECVICLSEFAPGEPVRILSKCNHGFHIRCIDKWLRSHSSCPKCRHCLIENSEKIAGSSEASPSGNSVPEPETAVGIRPLVPEGIICNWGT